MTEHYARCGRLKVRSSVVWGYALEAEYAYGFSVGLYGNRNFVSIGTTLSELIIATLHNWHTPSSYSMLIACGWLSSRFSPRRAYNVTEGLLKANHNSSVELFITRWGHYWGPVLIWIVYSKTIDRCWEGSSSPFILGINTPIGNSKSPVSNLRLISTPPITLSVCKRFYKSLQWTWLLHK